MFSVFLKKYKSMPRIFLMPFDLTSMLSGCNIFRPHPPSEPPRNCFFVFRHGMWLWSSVKSGSTLSCWNLMCRFKAEHWKLLPFWTSMTIQICLSGWVFVKDLSLQSRLFLCISFGVFLHPPCTHLLFLALVKIRPLYAQTFWNTVLYSTNHTHTHRSLL